MEVGFAPNEPQGELTMSPVTVWLIVIFWSAIVLLVGLWGTGFIGKRPGPPQ